MYSYSVGQKVEYRDLDRWNWPWIPATVIGVWNEPDHIGDFWVVHVETWHHKRKRLVGPMIRFQLRAV